MGEIPTFEMQRVGAPRRLTIYRRLMIVLLALFFGCIAMAFIAKQYDNGSPNLIWLYFAMWPGGAAVLMGLGGWILTGRL